MVRCESRMWWTPTQKNKAFSKEIMDEWPMSRRKYIWIQSGVSNNCGISLNTIYTLSVVIRDGHCDFSEFQLRLKFSPKTFNPLIETFKINRILHLNCFSTLHDNEHYNIIVFVISDQRLLVNLKIEYAHTYWSLYFPLEMWKYEIVLLIRF